MQTFKESLIEKFWDIGVSGPILAGFYTYYVLPLNNPADIYPLKAISITLQYTVLSFCRSIIFRRYYDWKVRKRLNLIKEQPYV